MKRVGLKASIAAVTFRHILSVYFAYISFLIYHQGDFEGDAERKKMQMMFKHFSQVKFVILALIATLYLAQNVSSQIPANYQLKNDWLIEGEFKAQIVTDSQKKAIVLDNGLIRRTISLTLGTTIGFENLMTGETIIRAVQPEGSIAIDGATYKIGGAIGQPNKAYLTPEWLANLNADPKALKHIGHEIGEPKERIHWKRIRNHEPNATWPPKGKYLRLDYKLPNLDKENTPKVSVHFELYDNMPVLMKWLTVENPTSKKINIDRFNAETLSVVEHVNQVESRDGVPIPVPRVLHVETDMAFGGFTHRNANRHTVKWGNGS